MKIAAPNALEALARRAILVRLAAIADGALRIEDGAERLQFGALTARCQLSATVRVHDPRFYTELAFGGSIGAGEAYMSGYWSTDDLTAVMRVLISNMSVVDGMEGGLARFGAPLRKALHWAAHNSRRGSRRNISAHYDLGNEFFRIFLDPTLMYSAAIFERTGMSLEKASLAKLDRICRRLELKPVDHLLEIGTGWGAMALHAAGHYGCRVTTTTISREQYELARERIDAAGLADRITLLQEDYRDLRGQYDKLVSIEMIEAVGYRYYDAYFRQCGALLKPDGMMLLQAITIADQRYESARNAVDFIQRHIFPGSCIPSVTVITDAVTRVTDMRLVDLLDIGVHYATTLRCWRENLFANLEQVRALGYPEEFIRMWEFYFCYCEGGFIERVIGDAQMLFIKPLARPAL
ncbi:MAG: cyclopropane-fatty-acyl-phospholipid synthase family protein [Candidatus Nitrotoga sp.]|jgi:cyclopropane-fatty-acyl-phospholipid synthase|nr:cyclopropane-fatty-acyl-phospholipid synthase family protein [Candidatus Nitrotoga sp.]MDW7604496.1 cyclopropane-fatty-acyl-phospholipid synthase family protein [Candidatus Nitrotoga sp.]